MHSFIDEGGNTWRLDIDITSVQEVKADLGIDMMEFVDEDEQQSLLATIYDDPIKLGGIIASLCGDQIIERDMDAAAFGRNFRGDTIDRARDAFLEELVSFFPARKRAVLGKILTILSTHQTEVLTKAEELTDSPEMSQFLERQLKSVGDLFGGQVASLESTPAPASSENS